MRNKVKLTNIKDICFYIDEENAEIIYDFFKDKFSKKLGYIFTQIANDVATNNVYSNENFKKNIKNITAIKLKGKTFSNARIYCKDYKIAEQRIIILCELLTSKKQNKLRQKEQTIITRINDYDY